MKNLARVPTCDTDIYRELTAAGIPILQLPERQTVYSEVPYTLYGRIGHFRFDRAWTYWIVSGAMPFDAACKMYKNRIGKKDVRVCGDCACRSPELWTGGKPIDYYHIDSEAGLKLFVKTAKAVIAAAKGE